MLALGNSCELISQLLGVRSDNCQPMMKVAPSGVGGVANVGNRRISVFVEPLHVASHQPRQCRLGLCRQRQKMARPIRELCPRGLPVRLLDQNVRVGSTESE